MNKCWKQHNKFSTLDSNNKLSIVQDGGADGIYNTDSNGGCLNAKPLCSDIINEQYKRFAKFYIQLTLL